MFYRFTLDLAIPESIYAAIPAAKKAAFRDAVLAVKAYAAKINAGTDGEEMTTKATWHKCNHDTNQPCEVEHDI